MSKFQLNKRKFIVLNTKLQNLLSEQLDLELLLNRLYSWKPKDKLKNWLDFKYAGREFDISNDWKAKIELEKQKKLDGNSNWNEEILNDNEIKRGIFYKLAKRKNELPNIIEKIIKEIEVVMGINPSLTDDKMAELFK